MLDINKWENLMTCVKCYYHSFKLVKNKKKYVHFLPGHNWDDALGMVFHLNHFSSIEISPLLINHYYFVTLTLIYIHFNGLSIHLSSCSRYETELMTPTKIYIFMNVAETINVRPSTLTFDWLTDLFGMWKGKIGSKHRHAIHGSIMTFININL